MTKLRTNVSYKVLKYILTQLKAFKSSIENLLKTSHEHQNINVLNSISQADIEKWNTPPLPVASESEFTDSEIIHTKMSIHNVSNFEFFNNFFNLTSIPEFPWLDGSSLVTFENYNDGKVSGNFLLVSESVNSNWLGRYYLTNWSEVGLIYSEGAPNNTIRDFRLKLTDELVIENYKIFKVVGSIIKEDNFGQFAFSENGSYLRDVLVMPLKN